MNINRDSVTGLLLSIVEPRLKYLIPREGQVKNVTDKVGKGRALVVIPSFGWDTPDKGVWCYSTDKNMMSALKYDDWVIVQFVDGNPDFPICIGKSTRIKDQTPNNYDGKDTTHILFESPDNKMHMKYDAITKILNIFDNGDINIDGTSINLNGDSKTFVTYAELNTALQAFKTSIESSIIGTVNSGIVSHTHVETGGTTANGVGTGTLVPTTIDISASQTTTIKTGG